MTTLTKFYRRDIDGLRAIAIISVIIFHMAPNAFPGGYAGVDVFFVISGYLITAIILKQFNEGTFSFKEFYVKRVIRLFPSLIIVIAATLGFGWFILLPHEFSQLGKHAAGGAGFIANLISFKEVGYFNNASELKPFLHLWSLGIEEQFYIVWPFLLFLTWKLKPSLIPFLAVCLIAYSFGINVNKVTKFPEYSFFLPQARFWELISGSLLAFFESKKFIPYHLKQKNLLAVIGVLLCFSSFLILNSSSQFPGYWALLPVLGTSLLIITEETWINRKLFSHNSLVFIGLISYPLYLWHWPLLSFNQIMHSGPGPLYERILLVGFAFCLAWASFEYVEKPLKSASIKLRNQKSLLLLSGVTITGLIGIAIFCSFIPPLSKNYGMQFISEAVGDWDFPGTLKEVVDKDGNRYFTRGDNQNKTIFIGDSNIEQYLPRIEKILDQHPNSNSVIFVTGGGCPPIPNVISEGKYSICNSWIENGFQMAAQPEVNTVVLGAQWNKYFSNEEKPYFITSENKKLPVKYAQASFTIAIKNISEKIKQLKQLGKQVFVILNIPVGQEYDPIFQVQRSLSFPPLRIKANTMTAIDFIGKYAYFLNEFEKEVSAAGAEILNPLSILCPGQGNCLTITKSGKPIYKDVSHLRPFFVRENLTFLDQTIIRDDILTSRIRSSSIKP